MRAEEAVFMERTVNFMDLSPFTYFISQDGYIIFQLLENTIDNNHQREKFL